MGLITTLSNLWFVLLLVAVILAIVFLNKPIANFIYKTKKIEYVDGNLKIHLGKGSKKNIIITKTSFLKKIFSYVYPIITILFVYSLGVLTFDYPSTLNVEIHKLRNAMIKEYEIIRGTENPGINIDASEDKQPLMDALLYGNILTAKELINKKVGLHEVNEDGETPLHLAALRGFTDLTVKLSKYIDVNIKDKNGRDPLMLAAMSGNNDTMNVLIEHGADTLAKCNYGCNALITATSKGNFEGVKLLVKNHADVNVHNDGNTVLMIAIVEHHYKIAEYLIRKGADVNYQTKDGEFALGLAIYGKSYDIAELLLKNKANVNKRDKEGKTPLHISVLQENPKMVSLLRKFGASITIKDNDGKLAYDYIKGKKSKVLYAVLSKNNLGF